MLITKFNAMIRNRVVWAIFAVIVSVSFIGVFTQGGGCQQKGPSTTAEGMLFGEPVSPNDFLLARFYELGMRPPPSLSPEANMMLRTRTWERIAALRAAEQMGLSVSNTELLDVIRRDRSFAVNNVFSRERYQAVVEGQLRVPVGTFESYLRQELLLQKVAKTMQAAVWISPLELTEKLYDLTDAFDVEYTLVEKTNHVANVELTQEDTEAFFEENKELFTIPDKVNVRYVAFPTSNYLGNAEIADAEIDTYYEDNEDEYSSIDTNGETVVTPLEDVRDEIVDVLRERHALYEARDAATELAMALAPDRYGNARAWDEAVAAAEDVIAGTSAFFSATETVPGLAVGQDFNDAAFALEPKDPERYFSDPISGEDAVYVIADLERREARDPEFSEVVDLVTPIARQAAEEDAFAAEIENARAEILSEIENGGTFSGAVARLDMNLSTTGTFTVYQGLPEDMEHADALLAGVMHLGEGDMAEPLEIPGGAILARVAARRPGEIASMQFLRPQVQSALTRYRSGTLFEAFRGYLLTKGELEDLRPPLVDETDQEVEGEPEPSPEAES